MYFKSHSRKDGGISTLNGRAGLCFVVLLTLAAMPPTSPGECNPVGVWEGTWHSFDGANGPIELVITGDGRVEGEMQWDLRPHLPQVLTFEIDTTAVLGPEECCFSCEYSDTQPVEAVPGYWIDITLDIAITGCSLACDDAGGTYSGTSYVPGPGGGTFAESGTWETHRTSVPNTVANMDPADGSKGANVWSVLDWSWPPGYGYGACRYDVYLGTDFDVVRTAGNPNTLPGRGNQSEMTYIPGKLLCGRTHYWRVDARNTNGVAKGPVWSFTTCGLDLSPYGRMRCEALPAFAGHWLGDVCAEPGWCETTDLDCSGSIDLLDFAILGEYWRDCSLIGHWKMDDNRPDTTVFDSSTKGNHGAARRNTSAIHTAGVLGGALSFDGGSDFVSIPDRDLWRLDGDFVIALWARFDSFSTKWWEAAFIGQDEGGGNRNKWIFSYDPAGRTTLFHINKPSIVGEVIAGEPWLAQAGEWYLVGVSRAGDTYTFYRQGEANGSAVNATTIPDVAAPLTIGRAEGAGRFAGAIDDVRIHSLQ